MNAFLVSKKATVTFYDMSTYKEMNRKIIVPLFESTSREANEIISMQVSQKENFLAIISGKNLNMNE